MQKTAYSFDTRRATLNQRDTPDGLAPNHFTKLDDCVVLGGAIQPRLRPAPYLNMLPNGGEPPPPYAPVYGVANFEMGEKRWLVMGVGSLSSSNESTYLRADRFNIGANQRPQNRETISTKGGSTDFAFHYEAVPVRFAHYRNRVYASNGFEAFASFDGGRWDRQADFTDFRYGFPWRCGVEFLGRFFIGNTPCWPNEVLYTDAFASVDAGAGESQRTAFTEALYLSAEEAVRAMEVSGYNLFIFTSNGIYGMSSALTVEKLVSGFETFGDRSVAQFGGGFWIWGALHGKPGLYFWRPGSDKPEWVSYYADEELRAAYLGSYPGESFSIWPIGGWGYRIPGDVAINDDMLNSEGKLKSKSSSKYGVAYSHGAGTALPSDSHGFTVPNLSNWGSLEIEYVSPVGSVYEAEVKVAVRVGKRQTDGTIDWDGFAWANADSAIGDNNPIGGILPTQGTVRTAVVRLNKLTTANKDTIQFRIMARSANNAPGADEAAEIWRVCLRALSDSVKDESPVTPTLIPYGDSLYAFFSRPGSNGYPEGRALVIGRDNSLSVCNHGHISAATTYEGRLFMGTKEAGADYLYFTIPHTQSSPLGKVPPYHAQVIDTGRFDFSTADNPEMGGRDKALTRISVAVEPIVSGAGLDVTWWVDADTNSTMRNTARITGISPAGKTKYYSIELRDPATYSLGSSAPAGEHNNVGKYFRVRIAGVGQSMFKLLGIKVEAEVGDETFETVFEAH